MSDGLLDLAGKVEPPLVDIFAAIDSASSHLELPYMVVGATARDLVMHHGYGARIVRATKDVDFAIYVPNWRAFAMLIKALLAQGFRETKLPHRLVTPSNWHIDLVPFGSVEEDGSIIRWPPDQSSAMNVLGFREAYENAIQVRFGEDSDWTVSVVSPCGLALLKIIAWTDRDRQWRPKDAQDIAYLLRSYEEVPAICDRAYDDQNLMVNHGWDLTAATAHLLGRETAQIASQQSREVIEQFHGAEELPEISDVFISEMGGNEQIERNTTLWRAFLQGFMAG